MTEENLHLLEKIYQTYNNPVKPLLTEIEAVYEKFPIPIYNEIRALNDHVARAFMSKSESVAKNQILSANNHIRRITRDCYKYLNVYYKDKAERFDDTICRIDPQSKQDFDILDQYGKLSDKATELVKVAKTCEHTETDNIIYTSYENAYHAYKDLDEFIVEHTPYIRNIRLKRRFSKISSILISILTFIIGCIIINNNQFILDFAQQLISFFYH